MPDPNTLGKSPLASAEVLSPSSPPKGCPLLSEFAFRSVPRGCEHLDAREHAGPRLSPSGNSAGEGRVIPQIPQQSHTSGTHRSRPQLPRRLPGRAPRATCSPHAQYLGSVFLPAALSPPFPGWNAAESCGNHGSPLPGTLRHRCLSWLVSWCQHCQKPDRHQSTEQWKSELIYLRKKTPKLVKRRGRHRLQALEALVRTTPRNQLYTTERERGSRGRAHPDPQPCPSTPCTGAFQPSAPFSLHHHESAAGRGGTGPGTTPRPSQLLAFPCGPKT